jgi:hypothetical protein
VEVEVSPPIAPGAEDVAVGIEIEEIAEGLDGNDGPGAYALDGEGVLKELLKAVPATATQVNEEFTVIEEVTPEDLWDAEGEVSVGDRLEDLLA